MVYIGVDIKKDECAWVAMNDKGKVLQVSGVDGYGLPSALYAYQQELKEKFTVIVEDIHLVN
jgi:hypothetical protein